MILTVNLGNTHITIGGYEHDDLKFCGRLHTDPAATVDEYGLRLLNLLSLHGASPEQIEGGILGSVVPALTGRVLAALQMLCPVRILTVGPGLKSGIRLRLDNPAQLGAELLCGAVAALAELRDHNSRRIAKVGFRLDPLTGQAESHLCAFWLSCSPQRVPISGRSGGCR